MTKKRLAFIVGPMAGCACIALMVLFLLPPGPGVTKANFDRIEDGMTRKEVEEIFGGKGKELVTGGLHTRIYFWYAADESMASIEFTPYGWDGNSFSEEATILSKGWSDSEEPLGKKIRRWLHLP